MEFVFGTIACALCSGINFEIVKWVVKWMRL